MISEYVGGPTLARWLGVSGRPCTTGKKTLEPEILKEALEHATGSKKLLRLPPSPLKDGSR